MYTENEHFYIAEEGYCFKPKDNDSVMPTMIFKNRISGYDYIERPAETESDEEATAEDYEAALKRMGVDLNE